MPSVAFHRQAIVRRLLELVELDPEFGDMQTEVGAPYTDWAEASRYLLISRVTGSVDHPLLRRPVIEDRPIVEVWVQAFDQDALEAARIGDETVTLFARTVARNRQLALDDDRCEGVQTCMLDQLDGPLFMRTAQGMIVSYRLTLNVICRISTED